MKKKIVGIFVCMLLIATVLPVSGNAPTINDGTLSGYVNDTSMNPIEGVLVRVYFHEAYEEDYTDSTGYYHVTNIPICYCLKNCTASKTGYKREQVLLAINEDTTYDFVLKSSNIWVVTDTPIKPNLINSIQKFGGMKTLFIEADCNKILLYKVWWYPVHIGSFWFTSKFAYLCFFIEKDFVLKINGVDQEVELPAMVVPWRYIGFGPIWNPRDPSDGNVSLIGICENVIIEPYNISMTV